MNTATHFSQFRGKSWQRVKGEMIGRYGSVREVAARVGCHPNSLRVAVEGHCPGVQRRLETLFAAPDEGGEYSSQAVDVRALVSAGGQ